MIPWKDMYVQCISMCPGVYIGHFYMRWWQIHARRRQFLVRCCRLFFIEDRLDFHTLCPFYWNGTVFNGRLAFYVRYSISFFICGVADFLYGEWAGVNLMGNGINFTWDGADFYSSFVAKISYAHFCMRRCRIFIGDGAEFMFFLWVTSGEDFCACSLFHSITFEDLQVWELVPQYS